MFEGLSSHNPTHTHTPTHILTYTSCSLARTYAHICTRAHVRLHVHIQANSWIPSPNTLAEYERGSPNVRTMGMYAILSIGSRAYLRLGRDDEALETARIAVRFAFVSLPFLVVI